MSDDDIKDNVVEGVFRRIDEADKDENLILTDAGEMLYTLAHCCDPTNTAAVTLLYTPGKPVLLAGNVEEEYINVLLDMAKYEIMHRMLAAQECNGGPDDDDTVH